MCLSTSRPQIMPLYTCCAGMAVCVMQAGLCGKRSAEIPFIQPAFQQSDLRSQHSALGAAGTYGQGFGEALLSVPHWLPHQRDPVVFGQVKWDVWGGFPFSIFHQHRTLKPEVGPAGLFALLFFFRV